MVDTTLSASNARENPAHGGEAGRRQVICRLARIEGQVRGVARMVADERSCIDVITQISAIHAALDAVALALLDSEARACTTGTQGESPGADRVDELMRTVGRLVGSR